MNRRFWPVAEPSQAEARVVRSIFRDYVQNNVTIRQITRGLNDDGIPSPSGKDVWGFFTICRLLRNEAYVGRVYFNRREDIVDRKAKGGKRRVLRPRDQWIAIPVATIVSEEIFDAAQRVSRDNSKWSPRRAEPGHRLLRYP